VRKRREHFKITDWVRRYDARSEKFIIDIAYRTATEITPRTIAVSEAFGVGVDQEQKFTIYDNVELKIGPKDIVLITGDSGSGKSVLLRVLQDDIQDNPALGGVVNIASIEVDPGKPLIETVGKTVEEGLELLSRVGLNDAFLFVRRFKELSDGQKYRYRIAKMIESGAQWWVMDEFCACLDRETAKIVAFNVQKLARQTGKGVLAATTHMDLFDDLVPSVHVHKHYGKEITVDYYINEPAKECTLVKDMCVVKASLKDYRQLEGFHYRDSGSLPIAHKVFALKRGEELIGAIVYKSPSLATIGRILTLGRKIMLQELNKDWTLIGRVVVHPKYRTIGLGEKLVRDTLLKCGRPYVESVAVMARFNPFFERAGMRKIAVSQADRRLLRYVAKLEELGFSHTFLSSQAYNLHKLEADSTLVVKVKAVLRDFGRNNGLYRKRLAQVGDAFLDREKFKRILDEANPERLAKMLKILSILTQSKVYLFWRNDAALTFSRLLQQHQD